MLKNIFTFSLLCTAMFGFAQTESKLLTNQQFHAADTSRTFTLVAYDPDVAVVKLTNTWGSPVKQGPGRIIWENVSIDGIGSGLLVEMLDGVFTRKESTGKFTVFKNDKQKSEPLDENQFRNTTIEIKDVSGNNVIRSDEAEAQARSVIETQLQAR